MAWAKGQSGNPGGRPRKSEEQQRFERRCREWAELFALDKLKKAADSDKPSEAIAAIKEILDRGFGKAEAISYVEASVTDRTSPSPAELAAELGALISEAAGESGESSGTATMGDGK